MIEFLALLESERVSAAEHFCSYSNKWAAGMGFLIQYQIAVNRPQYLLDYDEKMKLLRQQHEQRLAWPWYKKVPYLIMHGEL